MRRDQGNLLSDPTRDPVVRLDGPRERPVVPFELPPAPRLFVGRRAELAELDHRPPLVVVSGPSGIGKTSLALRWLHDNRERFPDGQLHVDLDAYGSPGPATPSEVLEWFLLALGVGADCVPLELGRRQALFRSMVADRACAVLLDNAASSAQVRPLLGAGTVLVTSRWRLSGLAPDGARFLEVGPLDRPASAELLGGRAELAEACGGLPIALSVMGARLSTRPPNLEILRATPVDAALDLSFVELPERQARVYRWSALHPGGTFGVDVAAAAVDEPVSDVEDALDDLVEKNLLTAVSDDRFRFHDLVRAHARQRAEDDPRVDREAVVLRVVEWYMVRAEAANQVVLGADVADRAAALAWLEDERGNLVNVVRAAAERNWHAHVWHLCEALHGLFLFRHHYPDWLETHVLGVAAARHVGARAAEAHLRLHLGRAYAGVGRSFDAVGEFTSALRTAEAIGDDGSRAIALHHLAELARARGDFDSALARLLELLSLQRSLGGRHAEAVAHQRIGELLTEAGRYDEAVDELQRGEEILTEVDDVPGVAGIRLALAEVHLKAGRPDVAEPLLEDARTVLAVAGCHADVLARITTMRAALGE